jgi:fumarate reductase flavoprotein subunit
MSDERILDKGLSRRNFLKGAALTTVVAGAAMAGCSPQPTDGGDNPPPTTPDSGGSAAASGGSKYTAYPNPDDIGIVKDAAGEETVDFAIIGSGLTGLTAAMITAEQMPDAKVLLIEKLPFGGGNGNFAEICAVSPPTTYEAAHARAMDLVKNSSYMKDPDLLTSLFLDGSKNTSWLSIKHDIQHEPGGLYYETWNGNKSMKRLLEEIETGEAYANLELRLNTRATALLMADEYTCTGVQVKDENGYTNISAKAVLLGTGGCATNLELLSYYTGADVAEKCFGIGAGQDGDGFLMVEQTAHGQAKEIYETGMFNNAKDFSLSSPFSVAAVMQPINVFVTQNGVRFSDESTMNLYPFIPTGKAIEHYGRVYSIVGQNLIEQFETKGSTGMWWYYYNTPTSLAEDLEQHAGSEYLFKADTLEDLAKAIDVPADALVKTIEDYDAMAAGGTDDAVFGKTAEFMVPLGGGPYYALRIFSGVCQTNGGIRVNDVCQVLDPYYKPIEGLFAGGIGFSGLNVEVYSTGTAQAAALWSGSKVARHVVANLLGGTVADNWFGDEEYAGGPPSRDGLDPCKPLLGTDFE